MRLSAVLVLVSLLSAPPALAQSLPDLSAPLERAHPLVGKIWLPATHAFVDADTLFARVGAADTVVLGETHDNADHHALQTWMVHRLMAQSPPMPLVAFEMFDRDQEPTLAAYLSAHPGDAAGLGDALGWDTTGWPDWREFYRPIAQAALDGGATLAPANLSKDDTREIAKGNIPRVWAGKLGLEALPTPEVRQAMEAEIQAGHCNLLPDRALPAMVRVQRGRDAAMAWAVLQAPRAILIAGAGHARRDRGVPQHVAEMAPQRSVFSLAFLEVQADKTDPAAYAETYDADILPFDAVWFTPRMDRPDPCEAFKRHMDKKKD